MLLVVIILRVLTKEKLTVQAPIAAKQLEGCDWSLSSLMKRYISQSEQQPNFQILLCLHSSHLKEFSIQITINSLAISTP